MGGAFIHHSILIYRYCGVALLKDPNETKVRAQIIPHSFVEILQPN